MQLDKINDKVRKAAADIGEVAGLLWEKGWAEGCAGNISVNVTEFCTGIHADFINSPMIPLEVKYPAMANHYFFITVKGSRMRDLAKDQGKNLCFIKISGKGDGYQVLFGDPDTPQIPSSELPCHLAVHHLMKMQGQGDCAVVHTHAHELVALSHDKNLQSESSMNEVLLHMHTETAFFIPEGIGYVGLKVPGSRELAEANLKSMKNHRIVLWEKHGCLAVGKNVHEAFDRIDLMVKAARIYLTCRQAGINFKV